MASYPRLGHSRAEVDEFIDTVDRTYKNLETSKNNSVRQGTLVGVSSAVCGILMGPIGLGVGAMLGAAATTFMTNIKSIRQLLRGLNEVERRVLYNKVRSEVESKGFLWAEALLLLITNKKIWEIVHKPEAKVFKIHTVKCPIHAE